MGLISQVHTQEAWWNRIPLAAWVMMGLIAVAANLMVGYGAHRRGAFLFVLPVVVSISFLLIADIDSPRGGIIRVLPQNLLLLSQSLRLSNPSITVMQVSAQSGESLSTSTDWLRREAGKVREGAFACHLSRTM